MLGLGLTKYIPLFLYVSLLCFSIFAFRYPNFATIIIVTLLPFKNILLKLTSYPIGKDIVDLYAIILLIMLIIYRGRLFFLPKIFYIYLGYQTLLLFFAIPSFSDPWPIIQDFKNFMLLPLFATFVYNFIRDKRDVNFFLIAISLALLYADRTYIRNLLAHGNLGVYRDTLRDSGIFVVLGSNELATFYTYLLFLPLCLSFFVERKFLKYVLFGLYTLTLIVVLFTYSRAAYLSTIATSYLLSIVLIPRTKKFFIAINACLLCVILAYNVILPASVVQRINMTFSNSDEFSSDITERLDKSAQQRLMLWEYSKQLIFESPLIGHGFEYTRHGLVGIFRDPHNKYIETLIEGGIINLILFISLFLTTIKKSLEFYFTFQDNIFKGIALGTFCATIVMMISNFFGDRWTYLELGSYYWSLLGLLFATKEIETSTEKSLSTKKQLY